MDIEQLLAHLKVDFQRIEHPPLATCHAADQLGIIRPGTRLKHLFLRDNYGRQHFLLVTRHDKTVDLKALSRQQGISRLGFASARRLQAYLGVSPGAVSLLALVNDKQGAVQLWLDTALAHSEAWQCHPLVNTRTLVIPAAQLPRFFTFTGHRPHTVSIPHTSAD